MPKLAIMMRPPGRESWRGAAKLAAHPPGAARAVRPDLPAVRRPDRSDDPGGVSAVAVDDHVKPIAQGGRMFSIENLRPAHLDCDQRKGSRFTGRGGPPSRAGSAPPHARGGTRASDARPEATRAARDARSSRRHGSLRYRFCSWSIPGGAIAMATSRSRQLWRRGTSRMIAFASAGALAAL